MKAIHKKRDIITQPKAAFGEDVNDKHLTCKELKTIT